MPNEFSVRLVPAKMAGVVSPIPPPRVLYRSGHSVGLTESDVDSVSRFFFFFFL